MSRLRRHYLAAPDGGQVHLRVGGTGAPMLLLPDAPGSGAALTSLAADLVESGCAVALPDLLGAGGTTANPAGAGDLAAQARLAGAVADGLRWVRAVVLGDGAGAAVALALAAARPELVTGVGVLSRPYAGPDAPPDAVDTAEPVDAHAEHLLRRWHELRDAHLFRPGWRRTRAARRRRDMPSPAVLHEVFVDALAHPSAGRRVAEAARREWPGLAAAPARPVFDLPAPADAAAVLSALAPTGDVTTPARPGPAVPGLSRDYVDVAHGQLHVRVARPAEVDAAPGARPVLLLHANPGSAQGLEPVLAELGRDRVAVAPDLPGHGHSDPLPAAEHATATLSGSYLPVLLQALDVLGLERVDVVGTHTGAGLAVELAIAAPDRVGALVLDGVPLFDDDPELVASVLAEYFCDLTPDRHGSHLVRAWHVTDDMALWWPWFRQDAAGFRDGEPYPAEVIHRVTVDLLRSLPHYAVAYRAAWTWLGSRRLPLVTRPALVGAGPADPLRPATRRAADLMPAARLADFPGSADPGRPRRFADQIRDFVAGVADGR